MIQALLTDRAISMSEFKKNPAAVLRAAQGRPVAVLNHNRVGFYILEPQLLQTLLEELVRLRQGQPGPGGHQPAAGPHQELIAALLSQTKAAPP